MQGLSLIFLGVFMFTLIVLVLVLIILLAKSKLVASGHAKIVINDDPTPMAPLARLDLYPRA